MGQNGALFPVRLEDALLDIKEGQETTGKLQSLPPEIPLSAPFAEARACFALLRVRKRVLHYYGHVYACIRESWVAIHGNI